MRALEAVFGNPDGLGRFRLGIGVWGQGYCGHGSRGDRCPRAGLHQVSPIFPDS